MPVAEIKRVFEVRGAVADAYKCRDKEILVHGPAGTGKSRGLMEKLHLALTKYKGARGLLVRKTRSSLTQTGLITFAKEVLTLGDRVHFHTTSQSFVYPNGSVLVVGGLDDSTKIMSSQYDIALFQEATEGDEGDWEDITSRLRNYVMPYQQLIGDCNPAPPTHWLWRRCLSGKTTPFESHHEDNPRYYDLKKKEWTKEGISYCVGPNSTLGRLSGVRYQRLFLGKWVSAEGAVYENWNPTKHILPRIVDGKEIEIPRSWPRYWIIDFGYNHPFVWQAVAEDNDGRLYRYREIYHTGRTVAQHCRTIRSLEEPKPRAIICDHDAEDRATFEAELGYRTIPAIKHVSTGIQAVTDRLRFQGDGKAKLYLIKDSLLEVDTSLSEAKLPTCTEEEFDSYVWDDSTDKKKEMPIKKYDHGMDAIRYLCMFVDNKKYNKPSIHALT